MSDIKRLSIAQRIEDLHHRGFDSSTPDERDEYGRFTTAITVRCSQCAALVICGVPTHETGCPNTRHECEECGTLIERRYRLCESCANLEPFEEE